MSKKTAREKKGLQRKLEEIIQQGLAKPAEPPVAKPAGAGGPEPAAAGGPEPPVAKPEADGPEPAAPKPAEAGSPPAPPARPASAQEASAAEAAHGSARPVRRDPKAVGTSIPWCKRFTPGHPDSRVSLPARVTRCRLHYDHNPGQWFAQYKLDKENMPAPFQHASKSKKCNEKKNIWHSVRCWGGCGTSIRRSALGVCAHRGSQKLSRNVRVVLQKWIVMP